MYLPFPVVAAGALHRRLSCSAREEKARELRGERDSVHQRQMRIHTYKIVQIVLFLY